MGGRAVRLEQTRVPSAASKTDKSAAARTDLGSCRLRNCTSGKLPLGKIPLVSCRLGKRFEKAPNIFENSNKNKLTFF